MKCERLDCEPLLRRLVIAPDAALTHEALAVFIGECRRADDPVVANIGEVVEPEVCADMTLDAMREKRFLVLPHPRVGESFARKADNYDAWIAGTNRRLRRMRGEQVD